MGLQNYNQDPAQATLYSLIFRGEAVLPLEILSLLKLAIHEEMTDEEKPNIRLAELKALDEDRLPAQQNLELCRQQMSNAFNEVFNSDHLKNVIWSWPSKPHDH